MHALNTFMQLTYFSTNLAKFNVSFDKIWKFCMKFGHMILRKIIKFVATKCQILRLKCTKFNFGWGSVLDAAWRTYSAPSDALTGFKGLTSKGGEGKKWEFKGDWGSRGGWLGWKEWEG